MTDDFEARPRVRTRLSGAEKPVVTYALLLLNLLLWITLEVSGGSTNAQNLIDFGALSAPLIVDGEYWRLFTAMFLHAGVMHILANSLSLFIFGQIVERTHGHARFALIYLLAGLFGSVASLTLNSTGVGVGASGAVFGIVGALAAYFVANRRVMGDLGRQNLVGLLVLVGINVVFGLTAPGIDNWAHMGGLASRVPAGPGTRTQIPLCDPSQPVPDAGDTCAGRRQLDGQAVVRGTGSGGRPGRRSVDRPGCSAGDGIVSPAGGRAPASRTRNTTPRLTVSLRRSRSTRWRGRHTCCLARPIWNWEICIGHGPR